MEFPQAKTRCGDHSLSEHRVFSCHGAGAGTVSCRLTLWLVLFGQIVEHMWHAPCGAMGYADDRGHAFETRGLVLGDRPGGVTGSRVLMVSGEAIGIEPGLLLYAINGAAQLKSTTSEVEALLNHMQRPIKVQFTTEVIIFSLQLAVCCLAQPRLAMLPSALC